MTRAQRDARTNWPEVIDAARIIVAEYDTPVTLRQLFYRLVAAGWLSNVHTAYSRLSSVTAKLRRKGEFPRLADNTRTIHQYSTWTSPRDGAEWLADVYRLDRTAGQVYNVFLGVEKAGIVAQLRHWFGEMGMPVVALGGYSSEGYVADITEHIDRDGRAAVLLYAGDFDPSGEDIVRDIQARTDFAKVVRVALTAEQVESYGLPEMPGKASDTRSRGFIERHGRLVQVELDALAPSDLRELFEDALADYWDASAYSAVLAAESADREWLVSLAERL